ncbi:MAG: endonuclease/exonuclease/phosphatase family protein [Deltaproteobacteria bacterium]
MKKFSCFLVLYMVFTTCTPLVDTISEERDCVYYSKPVTSQVPLKDTLLVMTWNIRFGCGTEILWFGDACGSRTVLKQSEVNSNLDRIISEINRIKPDILLLQEVDYDSKRSAYVDQMQYIMDRTYFSYGYFGTLWNSQFIPSDGLGRLNEGNTILSRWPVTEGKLYPLPLRGDIDALTKYFYVRETVMSAKITMGSNRDFYVINTHLSAFSTDDTKFRQLERYLEICDSISGLGKPMVTGGDYNLIPPGSDKVDYCFDDICPEESYHQPGDDPQHKEGSYYAEQLDWLNPLYNKYFASLPLNVYKQNQSKYFSHATKPELAFDRTLDYLFANRPFVANSHKTWQELRTQSDHAAVSALWIIK